jgi:hypothetical protein
MERVTNMRYVGDGFQGIVRDDQTYIPSLLSFIAQAIYPTWPACRVVVGVSSGCMIPSSRTSYFFRVKVEAILSPNKKSFRNKDCYMRQLAYLSSARLL